MINRRTRNEDVGYLPVSILLKDSKLAYIQTSLIIGAIGVSVKHNYLLIQKITPNRLKLPFWAIEVSFLYIASRPNAYTHARCLNL